MESISGVVVIGLIVGWKFIEIVVYVDSGGSVFEDIESFDDWWGYVILGLVDFEVFEGLFSLSFLVFVFGDLDFVKGIVFGMCRSYFVGRGVEGL